jgi:hypothetical protein
MFTQVFIYFAHTLQSGPLERKKYFHFTLIFFGVIQSSYPDLLMSGKLSSCGANPRVKFSMPEER